MVSNADKSAGVSIGPGDMVETCWPMYNKWDGGPLLRGRVVKVETWQGCQSGTLVTALLTIEGTEVGYVVQRLDLSWFRLVPASEGAEIVREPKQAVQATWSEALWSARRLFSRAQAEYRAEKKVLMDKSLTKREREESRERLRARRSEVAAHRMALELLLRGEKLLRGERG